MRVLERVRASRILIRVMEHPEAARSLGLQAVLKKTDTGMEAICFRCFEMP